jgi:hypothetical protein
VAKKKTTEQFKEDMKKVDPNIKILGEYVLSSIPIKYMCVCGRIAYARPNDLLQGIHCWECANEGRSKVHIKSHDTFLKEVNENNPDIEIIGKYVHCHTKIKFRCTCGRIRMAEPISLIRPYLCCCKERKRIKIKQIHNHKYKYNYNGIYEYDSIIDLIKNGFY